MEETRHDQRRVGNLAKVRIHMLLVLSSSLWLRSSTMKGLKIRERETQKLTRPINSTPIVSRTRKRNSWLVGDELMLIRLLGHDPFRVQPARLLLEYLNALGLQIRSAAFPLE